MSPSSSTGGLTGVETYRTFSPLQVPASYNLDQIIHAMHETRHISHASD